MTSCGQKDYKMHNAGGASTPRCFHYFCKIWSKPNRSLRLLSLWSVTYKIFMQVLFATKYSHLSLIIAKRTPGKSKEEAQQEKKQELEKRLEDVKGQLGSTAPPKTNKTPKKGLLHFLKLLVSTKIGMYKTINLINLF